MALAFFRCNKPRRVSCATSSLIETLEPRVLLSGSPQYYLQDDGSHGFVVIDAEDFDRRQDGSGEYDGQSWQVVTSGLPAVFGDAAVTAGPDRDLNASDFTDTSPVLEYEIEFTQTGRHYLWVHGRGPSGADNSLHADLSGTPNGPATAIYFSPDQPRWTDSRHGGIAAVFDIDTPGRRTLTIKMREDGTIVDRLLLTTDANYTPSGTGPALTERVAEPVANSSISGTVWADLNADGTRDPDEPGMPGVTVYLDDNDNAQLDWTDLNTNGVWDNGEGERWVLSSDELLGAVGEYRFDHLPEGSYTVHHVTPTGFESVVQPVYVWEEAVVTDRIESPLDESSQLFANTLAVNDRYVLTEDIRLVNGAFDAQFIFLFDRETLELAGSIEARHHNSNLGNLVATDRYVLAYGVSTTDTTGGRSVWQYDLETGQLVKEWDSPDGSGDFNFGRSVIAWDHFAILQGQKDTYKSILVDLDTQEILHTWSPSAADAANSIGRNGSIAVSDDYIAFGVMLADSNCGAVRLYDRSTYEFVREVRYDDVRSTTTPVVGDTFFGRTLAFHNGLLYVGADYADETRTNAGAVYVFDPDDVDGTSRVITNPVANRSLFGRKLEIVEDQLFVSHAGSVSGTQVNVYDLTPEGPSFRSGMAFGGGFAWYSWKATPERLIANGQTGFGSSLETQIMVVDPPFIPNSIQAEVFQGGTVEQADFGLARTIARPDLIASSDTGVSDTDNLTRLDNASDARRLGFEIEGLLAGDLVEVLADNGVDPPIVISRDITLNDGSLSVVTDGQTAVADATYSLRARITDAFGQWPVSDPLVVTIDTQDALPGLDPFSTVLSSPPLAGLTSEPVFSVQVSTDQVTFYQAQLDPEGRSWSLPAGTLPDLPLGSNNLFVRTTDLAGNDQTFVVINAVTVQPTPNISISDASVVEGDSGASELTFTVSVDNPMLETSRVDWRLVPETATLGEDYHASLASGSLIWFEGQSQSFEISVDVFGDGKVEADETLRVELFRDPVLGTGTWEFADAVGVGTILNDDIETFTSSITGITWSDYDGDGLRDPGEPGLADVTLYLDANDNGVRDPGEAIQLSNVEGEYTFAGLASGDHVIRQEALPGYAPTGPIESITPINETFPSTTLDNSVWNTGLSSGFISSSAFGEPSPPYTYQLSLNRQLVTRPLDLSDVDQATLSWSRQRINSPTRLYTEYRDANGQWQELYSEPGSSFSTAFIRRTYQLPPEALHDQAAIRWRGQSSSSNSYYRIDDLELVTQRFDRVALNLEVGGSAQADFGQQDVVAPTVVSSTLQSGDTLQFFPEPWSVQLSEPIDESASKIRARIGAGPDGPPATSNFSVFVDATSYDPVTRTAYFEIPELAEGSYDLTLSSFDYVDLSGNRLDESFVLDFAVDADGPRDLQAVEVAPLGSLVFTTAAATGFLHEGDFDSWNRPALDGQPVTVTVVPTDPDATLTVSSQLGFVTAENPGETITLMGTGTSNLAFDIWADQATGYTIEAELHAVRELTDSDADNPLDLEPSRLLWVSDERWAARGTHSLDDIMPLIVDQEQSDATSGASNLGTFSPLGQEFVPSTDRLNAAQVHLTGVGDTAAVQLRIREGTITGNILATSDPTPVPNGRGWIDVTLPDTLVTPGQTYVLEWVEASTDQSYVLVHTGSSNLYPLGRRISSGQPQPDAWSDFAFRIGTAAEPEGDAYRLDLSGHVGGTVDVVYSGPAAQVTLIDPFGQAVATATPDAAGAEANNLTLSIAGFSPVEFGQYTIQVVGQAEGDYTLVATGGILFEHEPNDDANAIVRQIVPGQSVLGHLITPTGGLFGVANGSSPLFTGGGTADGPSGLVEIDPFTGQPIRQLADRPFGSNAVSTAVDGINAYVLSGFSSNEVQLEVYDLASGQQREPITLEPVPSGLAFSALGTYDGQLVSGAVTNGDIYFFDAATGALNRTLSADWPGESARDITGADDRGSLFITGGTSVYEIDANDGNLLNTIDLRSILNNDSFFSFEGLVYADGLLYLSDTLYFNGQTRDPIMVTIDPDTGSLLSTFENVPGYEDLAFAPSPSPWNEPLVGEAMPDGGDRYSVSLAEGQTLDVFLRYGLEGVSEAFGEDLEGTLVIADDQGTIVATGIIGLGGGGLQYTAEATGDYTLQVVARSGSASYLLETQLLTPSDTAPPTVVSVEVGSSAWAPGFVDRLRADGLGELGYRVSTGAGQLLTLPWANLDQVSVRFSEDVTVTADDLQLAGINSSSLTATAFSYDAETFTATWTLSAPLGTDRYAIGLADTLTDTAGNRLDGDWANDQSTASGDGQAGGDFQFDFNVLVGDTDRSGRVLGQDFSPIGLRLGQTTNTTNYTVFADLDGNGRILGSDFSPVGLNLGQVLPQVRP
ncbi:MAG: SdrD B-like domain-containing protein [Planctomycetota bacterium]